MADVWLLDGYQTDFADLTDEVVQRTLEAARVGNAFTTYREFRPHGMRLGSRRAASPGC